MNSSRSYKPNQQLRIEFWDDYEHITNIIEYIVENVVQTTNTKSDSYRDLVEKFNTFITFKCDCSTELRFCTEEDCIHGGNYLIHGDEGGNNELILKEDRKSLDVIYECNEFCSCLPNCYNRLVQFGPRKDLKIENYSILGKQFGLTTLKEIPKGAFICEYSGEILCKEEAIKRHQANDTQQSMNYIICLNERPIASGKNEECEIIQTIIDPSRIGNIGRYLNHSCDPNCEIISVRIDGLIPKLGKSFWLYFNSFKKHNFESKI